MRGPSASVAISAYATVLLLLIVPAHAYRIKGSEDENKPFVPYEKGFVQNIQDPSTAKRTRVNHGYKASVLLGDAVGKNRLFSCPQMVGPSGDQTYHCRGPEYGVCDRRSGTCFCNDGYSGESCEDCSTTHFEVGGLCLPKRVCPKDCSHAGQCNYLTGTCECADHRMGDDCSASTCSSFHQFCTHCNDDGCVECEEGFSVRAGAAHGSQCEPCWRYDPRCRDCNADACTSCVDLLLLSIHRSGRRPQDPPLPVDELEVRELSVAVPFGSQQDDAFYDAEHYFLVDPASVPLNESAVECHQGLNFDDSINCLPYNLTSHIMCGNHGTITFESPEYAVREDGKQIRLTLRRSGGGVGEVTVAYAIYPITANYEDVTSTAYYTANQTVVFRPGHIRASFLLTINDDRLLETNETFSVHLSRPTGSARLGTQSRTIVTILDDDEQKTCSVKTTLGHNNHDLGFAKAGTPFEFNVYAKTCAGEDQVVGGDVIKVEAHKVGAENVPHGFDAPVTVGKCDDADDGSYACDVNATISGHYELDVYQLIPGGLKGYYYTDNYLSKERLDIVRTDAVVNFTWGTGAVTTFGRDFVSVRWEGYVRPSASETYTFWLDVDDHARLWVDGILLIDSWAFSPTSDMLHVNHDLTAYETHQLVLEYREILGNATSRLLWSSASTPLAAIPSSCLFYKEHIHNSPFSFQVLPSSTYAKETTAFGKGLYKGIAGKTHSFAIEPKDRFRNFRNVQGSLLYPISEDDFRATAELIDGDGGLGNSLIPAIISYDDESKMHMASYTPRTAGHYRLNITLTEGSNENHIYGSPFPVHTKPGETFAPESTAFGGYGHCLPWVDSPCSGVFHGMAGQGSTFKIEAFDLNRNKRGIGGDDWQVVVSSTLGLYDYNFGTIEDHGNGTYTATITPQVSGPNDLTISLNDSPLKGSPFQMNVIHGLVVGTSSFVTNEEDVNVMFAMTQNVFFIQATDVWGNNAVFCDSHPFSASVSVESEDIDANNTRITYVGSGKFEINVTPLKPFIYLSVKVNGSDIKRSPFNVTVHPGTFSASSSSASGLGIQRARAGVEATFSIQAKDEGGNSKVHDEALFDVHLVLVERSVAPVSLNSSDDNEIVVMGSQEFMGDGQYLVKYTCFVSGEYILTVRDSGGEDINESPFHVTVVPSDMSAPHSLVMGQGLTIGSAGEVAEVRVYGRDSHLNFVNQAVETIEMTLTLNSRHQSEWEANELNDPRGTQITKQRARDSGGGTFVLDYIPKFSGEYEVGFVTYSPGGLHGSYFSDLDLSPDHLVSQGLDNEVDKYWEDDHITSELIGNKSHLGAVWNGKLAADHDEEYLIAVECNDGGFASHAIDGKYTPWQSCYPVMTTSIVMKANEAVHFSLRYKSEEGHSFIVLKWSSATVSMEKIPSVNLYHRAIVGNTTLHRPVIAPNKAYAPQSVAVGNALRTAISGIEHEFLVESRDEYGYDTGRLGNLLLEGGTRVEVDAFHYQDEGHLQTSITDNENGTYSVKYTPGTAGLYFLSVRSNGSDIQGSPFLLQVEPGETDPSNSLLLGEDSIEGVTGRDIRLVMQAVDVNGNNVTKGGDEILVAMVPISGDESERTPSCKVDYAAGGLYSIVCPAASQTGNYLLHVDILTSGNAQPIKSSPFQATIYPGHAVPERTGVGLGEYSGNTVQFTSEAGLYDSFVVTAKDIFGNALNTGGNNFVARVRGDTNIESSEEFVEVVDQGNGNYVFAYRVSHPSTYEIDVSMVTESGLFAEYFTDKMSAKEGVPGELVVDEQINFNIRRFSDDFSLSDIRWAGYMKFPHTSVFDFEVTGIEGHIKLWIGNEMVLDTDRKSAVGSFSAIENVIFKIKIEYSLDINRLLLQLFWSSRKMRRQIVPKSHFFSSIMQIRGSPFQLVVLP